METNKDMSAKGGENEKKEKIAISVGFFLILLVIVFTLFRGKNTDTSNSDQIVSKIGNQTISTINYKTISATDLQKKLIIKEGNVQYTLLDVRPFSDYIKEHIIDSVNISLDEFPVENKINSHSTIVVIGNTIGDKDIQTGVDKLREEDFKNILVLAGGMESWKQYVGATVTYGDPTSFVDQSKVSYVESDKLNEAFKANAPMFIIDIRSNEEFNRGHLPGARNIPLNQLEKRRGEIAEKKIVVIGTTELEEFQASVQMYDMLLASPYVVKGGMKQWQEKNYPIVK